MSSLDLSQSHKSTVIEEYTPDASRAGTCQSERELELELIRMLTAQGYEYLPVRSEEELVDNLRRQLERLNGYTFSDSEWEQFFRDCIAGKNDGIAEKTRRIQADPIQNLHRDNGATKNIALIDKGNIHNNSLQVISQYEDETGECRYDVTILVNGLPLVHVELKRRGVAIREAFNQIKRYQRDSFWTSSGLYEYVQIFVISNGTHTRYYSNTTRDRRVRETGRKTGSSFEFTSCWADGKNRVISDLEDFTKTFFARHTLLNILTRYCVFTTEKMLLVMRPYQIAATERILSRIEVAHTYKKAGTLEAGGYIWHTTGSGKTLTSFKTAQLAAGLPYIEKVLFVVDRKDLDYQTMKEYDRFEKGAANGNASTAVLKRQLEDGQARIIITTIQKLAIFIRRNRDHPVFQKQVVLIFDECHRSQFGDMHKAITGSFKKYYLFGFTGTPIFGVNASRGGNPTLKTTPQAFGGEPDENGNPVLALHTYTVVNAISDGNVLPFRVDYINTMKRREGIADQSVTGIDTERALADPERISEIVGYVLDHFDQKTKRNSFYSVKGQRMAGFNSMFAVSSIPMAMRYYEEFRRQLARRNRDLTVAAIFSHCANAEDPEDILADEDFDTGGLDQTARDFLKKVILHYNETFHVSFDTSADKFQNYYRDLSQRMKNREIDLLIVVNMFLTGFDAPTLNTLWVDKNLRMHGLIQAFSRTNRILNSVKSYGNIVCFRNLQRETDEAIALFGDDRAGNLVILHSYDAYYGGFEENGKHCPGYAELIGALTERFPVGGPVVGEGRQREFISLFGGILRLKNILSSFDQFAGNEILPTRDFQDYQSAYIDLYQEFSRRKQAEKEPINDDIIFEMELIRQVEINIDYILMLVEKYRSSHCEDQSVLVDIDKAVDSSLRLRSKKELIRSFLAKVNVETDVDGDWRRFVLEQKEADLAEIIREEKLKQEETEKFVENTFRDGALKTTGTDLDRIMPPVSRFGGGNRTARKLGIVEKLTRFFEKYVGLI